MRIGCCAKPEAILEVAEAGFDYIELPVSGLAEMDAGAFGEVEAMVASAPIPADRFNVLFPGSLALLDPATENRAISVYLDTALSRVAALGGRVVVFGSGRSRMRPENVPYPQAFRRLVEVTRVIGEAAARYGLMIAIEPLHRGECNMINCVVEGACLAAAADHPNVGLLADYYHIAMENEKPEEIRRVSGIIHAHIAALEGRHVPLEADEGYLRMFRAMKATGYAGTLSVEGKADDLSKEGPVSLRLLREMWEQA